jgi:membrane-associated phospholipid phosphatase
LNFDRRSSKPSLLLAAAVSAFGFALLTANVLADGPSGWDRLLFRHLYSGESDWVGGSTPGQSNPVLNAAEPILYQLADARVLVLFAASVIVTLLVRGRVRAAVFFSAAVAVTGLVPVFKELVDRPSPFPTPGEPSFPSGHATGSMAAAAGIVVLIAFRRWRWLAGALGALVVVAVGIAAVADSGHWPSDVLAGWCLALAWVFVLSAAVGHRLERSPAVDGSAAEPRAAPPANARSPGST